MESALISPQNYTPSAVILSATSRWHAYDHPTGQLSIKTMIGGRAQYRLGDGRRIAVDDSSYLILNEGQPYQVEIDAPVALTSFCLFFPDSLAGQIASGMRLSSTDLLDRPDAGAKVGFFETLRPHDDQVTPLMREIQQAHGHGEIETGWLEERLHRLVGAMLRSQGEIDRVAAGIEAARAATRQELYRRLCIARDAMHARLHEPITLAEIAQIAALSPYHFLRAFKQAFGVTPHEYLTKLRIDEARFLLRRTDMPITEICFALGFSSVGSFSTLFRRAAGVSPREYRQQNTIGKTA